MRHYVTVILAGWQLRLVSSPAFQLARPAQCHTTALLEEEHRKVHGTSGA